MYGVEYKFETARRDYFLRKKYKFSKYDKNIISYGLNDSLKTTEITYKIEEYENIKLSIKI